ncbi:hypothetical protein [Flavobacterium algicola]|uniref:hypothetical protein n=1 Tax=Flavobacterium algicola TaxID=556529 RepID=UPI001EFEB41A|nr:hypothetical protein [Flavobacterium algicola]MCG9792196.1 hypothetical protein [Flavobacterium algicola]
MKKRLEADLISIAHRILQLKNKSDVNQLFLETQKLYEKLSVLRFVEEQYGEVKPTIGHAAMVNDVASFYDNEDPIIPVLVQDNVLEAATATEVEVSETLIAVVEEPAVEALTSEENKVEENLESVSATETTLEEEINEAIELEEALLEEEPLVDEIATIEENEELVQLETAEEEDITEDDVEEELFEEQNIEEEVEEEIEIEEEPVLPPAFVPNFALSEKEEEEVEISPVAVVTPPKKADAIQISFEDLLGANYNEPQFVKVDEVPVIPPAPIFEPVKAVEEIVEVAVVKEEVPEKVAPKSFSLNDKLSKGIEIDLNDQIAFVKHLFGNSREDYNRVLNQLITFDNFYETKAFIDQMVKPDYNEWKGKEDYEERFMDIIEKKFL